MFNNFLNQLDKHYRRLQFLIYTLPICINISNAVIVYIVVARNVYIKSIKSKQILIKKSVKFENFKIQMSFKELVTLG